MGLLKMYFLLTMGIPSNYYIAMLVYWRMIQGDTHIEKMLSLDSVDRSFFVAFYHFGELEENRTN